MKLLSVPNTYNIVISGVVLTPQEYQKHEAYHPFDHVTSTTLFISYGADTQQYPCWSHVTKSGATGLAVLEATAEERRRLVEAGYRMMGLIDGNEMVDQERVAEGP